MLPPDLSIEVSELLSKRNGRETSIIRAIPLSGGSINEAYRLNTAAGDYFIKYNHADAYPDMFGQEARGLKLLKEAGAIRVPSVIESGTKGPYSFLMLEYLDEAPRQNGFWEDFGRKLAALHRHSAANFGLDHDNYIGSLRQYNNEHKQWVDFFREERLLLQLEMAARKGLLSSSTRLAFENLFKKLGDIFPVEPPALVHGDLWSGNYMTDDRGEACIIDPAVYYGFREMDIGMSRLFGVFGEGFYEAYNEAWPMAPGWRERVDICNLYPLLVHVNLFGAGYLGSVESILNRF
ncbi:MAG TPA: fructosamine kinase family protein [Bacteroidales bacterium]|nr:fructosamine kinase family protein [Bacteroidales bacterium]